MCVRGWALLSGDSVIGPPSETLGDPGPVAD